MAKIRNAQQLSDALGNFITVLNANLGTLTTLGAGDVTTLTGLKTTLDTDIANRIAAEEAAEAATATQNGSRDAGNSGLDSVSKKVIADPALTDALAIQLGMTVRDTVPSTITPVAPANLVVVGTDTGESKLDWDSGGNLPGVTYIIDARSLTTSPFVFVSTTTATKFTHTGQTPGVRMEYRVKAKRGNLESPYSNTAVVFA